MGVSKPEVLWFVLLVQKDSGPITTQNPTDECFETEADAVAFARESAKDDDDINATYHVMKTTHVVTQKRSVSITKVRP